MRKSARQIEIFGMGLWIVPTNGILIAKNVVTIIQNLAIREVYKLAHA